MMIREKPTLQKGLLCGIQCAPQDCFFIKFLKRTRENALHFPNLCGIVRMLRVNRLPAHKCAERSIL